MPDFICEVINQQQLIDPDAVNWQRLTETVLIQQGIQRAEIHLLLVDNATIHGMNLQFLNHDFATDVITFPLNEAAQQSPEFPLEGEIVCSTEMAISIAAEVGWSALEELQLYYIHGLLHLCGFDDLDPIAEQEMRRAEREILLILNVPLSKADSRWQFEADSAVGD